MLSRIYRESNKAFSPTFYLTLISIIQSLALGQILYDTNYEFVFSSQFKFNYILQSLIVFILILLVWHEYAMSTSCFKWVFSIVDSVLPFLYGVIQYYLIILRSDTELKTDWLYFLCGFLVLTIIAFANNDIKASDEKDKKPIFNFLGDKVNLGTYLFVLIALVIWSMYSFLRSPNIPLDSEFLILVLSMILAFLVYRQKIWLEILNREVDIDKNILMKIDERLDKLDTLFLKMSNIIDEQKTIQKEPKRLPSDSKLNSLIIIWQEFLKIFHK